MDKYTSYLYTSYMLSGALFIPLALYMTIHCRSVWALIGSAISDTISYAALYFSYKYLSPWVYERYTTPPSEGIRFFNFDSLIELYCNASPYIMMIAGSLFGYFTLSYLYDKRGWLIPSDTLKCVVFTCVGIIVSVLVFSVAMDVILGIIGIIALYCGIRVFWKTVKEY